MNRFLFSILGLCLVMVTMLVQAAPDVPRIPESADVRVIVDISGSMKQNDPDNLRQPAIRLLAEMLPDGSTAGVWTFGEYVNMLVPHGKVDEAWRKLAIKRSAKINSVALRTNLGRAMKVASDTFYSGGDLKNTHFILLTDGKVDISADETANEAERQRVLGEVLDRYKKLGATVHTVALSDQADLDFLTTLATQTGGSESIAKSADELNLAFLHALNAAVPQEQIPIRDNGFQVDTGVREFTVLVFSGQADTPVVLRDPDGERIAFEQEPEGVRWVRESSYNLITVDNPVAGRWMIDGTLGKGSRVTVVSDLKMVVNPLPARFYKGETVDVEATFYDGKKRITDPDFLSVITVSLSLTTQDGRSGTKVLSGDRPPADGVYRDQISKLEEPGDYSVRLVADGKTFAREFTGTISLQPPVRMVINATGMADQSSYRVMVKPEQPELDPKASGVVMMVTGAGQTRQVDLPFAEADHAWTGAVENVSEPGDYQVSLAFNGKTQNGEPLSYAPESFTAHFPRESSEQNVRIPLTAPPPVTAAAEAPQVPQVPEPQPSDGASTPEQPVATEPSTEEPGPAPVPEATPTQPDNSVESSAQPAPDKPEPAPVPEPKPQPQPDMTTTSGQTLILAGGGVAVLLALIGGVFWWRRRQSRLTDAEPPVADGQVEEDELPTLDPEMDGEAADEDEPEPDAEVPELEPEPESAEEEDIPKLDELAEDDIEQIVRQAEEADQAKVSDEAEIPLATEEAESEQTEEAEPEDQDIFDMEDFDLSDIDDLPDLDEPDDRNRKKD